MPEETPKQEGVLGFISRIVDFLKGILDLLTGKSSTTSNNPDGGAGATGSQGQAGQAAGEIAADPNQGVTTTEDGGIVYKDGKPVQEPPKQ
jgi:hypothetical protein